jgi:hypothetical protein
VTLTLNQPAVVSITAKKQSDQKSKKKLLMITQQSNFNETNDSTIYQLGDGGGDSETKNGAQEASST